MQISRRMQRAHNPAEAPPNHSDDRRQVSDLPGGPENRLHPSAVLHNHDQHTGSASPPVRKDTDSSISTVATVLTAALAAEDTNGTAYSSVASSPTNYASQGVFSAKDGASVAPQRRATRRRVGPLTTLQRERAHLIRKMGACPDCRRRRVAVSSSVLL